MKYQIFCNDIEMWSTAERAAIALSNSFVSTRLGDLIDDGETVRKMSEEERRLVFYYVDLNSAIKNEKPIPKYVPLESPRYSRIMTNRANSRIEEFLRRINIEFLGSGRGSTMIVYVIVILSWMMFGLPTLFSFIFWMFGATIGIFVNTAFGNSDNVPIWKWKPEEGD